MNRAALDRIRTLGPFATLAACLSLFTSSNVSEAVERGHQVDFLDGGSMAGAMTGQVLEGRHRMLNTNSPATQRAPGMGGAGATERRVPPGGQHK